MVSRTSGIEMQWEPEERLFFLRAEPGACFSEANTRAVLSQLDLCAGPEGPIRVLVDARNTERITLMFHLLWADYLRERRDRVRLGAYHLPPSLRVLADGVARVTRAPLRVFEDEASARQWLRGGALRPSPSVQANLPSSQA